MLRSSFVFPGLVALVSIPAFLVGHKLRQSDAPSAFLLVVALAMVVLIASAIARQSGRERPASDTSDARDSN